VARRYDTADTFLRLACLNYADDDPAWRDEARRAATLNSARLLLAAGADPNAGYLWHGRPSPFTVLTGAFGEGELGPVRQPRHPHSPALARLPLEAGALDYPAEMIRGQLAWAITHGMTERVRLLAEHGAPW
jgi:hypothetical protein